MRNLFWLLVRLFLIVWAGVAAVVFFDDEFSREAPIETATTERLVKSVFESFYYVTFFLGQAVGLASDPLASIGEEILREVDPLTGQAAPQLQSMGSWLLLLAKDVWWRVIVPVSIVQFCLLFVLRGLGAGVLWSNYPGIPRLENMTAKAVFWIVVGVVSYQIAVGAYNAGVWPSIATAIALPMVLMFPIIGALPIWIMKKVFLIDPRDLFLLPLKAARGLQKEISERADAHEAAANPAAPVAPVPGPSPVPPVSPGGAEPELEAQFERVAPSYEDACQLFGVVPNDFTQEEAATIYRMTMRQARSTPGRATTINLAYEAILTAHGWQQ